MKFSRALRQKTHTAELLVRRFGDALVHEGAGEAWTVLKSSLIGFLPGRRHSAEVRSQFDARFGVDTSGIVRIASMEIESPNYIYARYYKASHPDIVRNALDRLDLPFERYTFVDYGSGKGLTLLLASDYPFEEIIGVEFGADLHRIAEKNIREYQNPNQKCKAIRSVCGDATSFEPPDRPLVCYFYDPFEPVVLERVMRNLADSYTAHPRDIIVIFFGAPRTSALHRDREKTDQIFAACEFLYPAWNDDTVSVYKPARFRTAT